MREQVIYGTSVLKNSIPAIEDPYIVYPGKGLGGMRDFNLSQKVFNKHLLLLGGSGCGKTNSFLYTIEAMRKNMNQEDVAIIFDTKGEFYDEFYEPGDYVIGNSPRFVKLSHTWNIFEEILADGFDETHILMNAREMAAALFHGRGSSTQPFFCNAARDIFMGILLHFIRQAKTNPEKWRPRLNNKDLKKAFASFEVKDYMKIFSAYPDTKYMLTYFGDGTSGQALGVFGELNSMLSEYFIGILAEHNPNKSISMRRAVRNKGGKFIFVEYDIAVGEILTPVYRMLIDQALKEALSRRENIDTGKVFLIADEFKLLPELEHIDDSLNFGRGLGVHVMAGIQSIDQLYNIYGKEKGAVIASGFGSIIAYHTNDASSRNYVTERFGPNMVSYEYTNLNTNVPKTQERNGNVVEQWDQIRLGVGQAVIGLGYEPPFLFKFDEYRKKRNERK